MINSIEGRVSACFANVFPDLSTDQIIHASTESLPQWDSLAHITLLSAIAEEFGYEVTEELIEELISYTAIVSFIERNLTNT